MGGTAARAALWLSLGEFTMKFSVIVPVYNAEATIQDCVGSLMTQIEKDYEIIIVDDGSTDSTPLILDEMAEKYSQIRVIHQSNQGVSGARNKGILYAKGSYLTFVDSDDTVTNSYLSSLLSEDADAVVGDIRKTKDNALTCTINSHPNKVIEDFSLFDLCEMADNNALDYCCAKRYKTDIIRKNEIAFALDLSLGEDTLFFAEYLTKCKSVAYTGTADYFYHMNEDLSLSAFNKSYVERMQETNIRLGNVLEQRFPGFKQSKSFLKRQWSVFYYAIFYELKNANYSRKEKSSLLRRWFRMDLFKNLIRNSNVFMINDPPILQWIVKQRSPIMMILYYDLGKKISKQTKSSKMSKQSSKASCIIQTDR